MYERADATCDNLQKDTIVSSSEKRRIENFGTKVRECSGPEFIGYENHIYTIHVIKVVND